ncbi:MAG: molybdopterin-synthase adenylyltransferase MoeB [Thermoplasmata archaeon]|nr:molybdopterin-synthase adenylyltransferase MoeB [Thermoplasmata archaeon]
MATRRRTEVAKRQEARPALRKDQIDRYSRHLLLPEVGAAGQRKLLDAKVLLVGAGGLGAPAALYLAAAGVGTLGIVDFDTVDASNLQRQVLYTSADVGRPKVQVAAERLQGLNPDVTVEQHPVRLERENARKILERYDVVLDGTDNFATRYLVNDACVLLGRPNVQASIYRFEGQASVFDARRGPCYRCLFPQPPPPELVPNCATAGVLGVLPGLLGTIQATEAIKLVLGVGEPLVGRLFLIDALSLRTRELSLEKNPDCVLCGPHATQTDLIDYPAFCGETEADEPEHVPEITPEELAPLLVTKGRPFLLDVREQGEWEIAHLEGARLIPGRELATRSREVPDGREVVVYCKSGRRSAAATRLLIDLGRRRVRSLKGGLEAWADRMDPSMPRY